MFCPKCKSEYRQGFTRCSDCDVDLVYELKQDTVPEAYPDKTDYVCARWGVSGAL